MHKWASAGADYSVLWNADLPVADWRNQHGVSPETFIYVINWPEIQSESFSSSCVGEDFLSVCILVFILTTFYSLYSV